MLMLLRGLITRICCLLLVLLALPAGKADAACLPPPAGLVGWWSADGDANDLLHRNNGTLQGGATASATGLVGPAFTFDGTNNYVQIPDSTLLRPTNLTIEAWVRFDGLDSTGNSLV